MRCAVPKLVEIPAQLKDKAKLKKMASSPRGRAMCHDFIENVERAIAANRKNEATCQEVIRLVREALTEVAA